MILKSRILLFVLSAASAACLSACRDQGVGRWVDPNIGGVAPLLTTVTPQVHRPHSMVRVFPVTEPGLNDRYFSDRIYGIALNMPRYRSGVVGSVMPAAGALLFVVRPRFGRTASLVAPGLARRACGVGRMDDDGKGCPL